MSMKNPWPINDPASFHPFVRSKQTIPSSRPVLPDVWLRAAVKHGRRPPRQRRVPCLRAVRSHTTLDAGGRASTSASRPPLQRTGSGSGKSIKNRAHDSIKERDPAHLANPAQLFLDAPSNRGEQIGSLEFGQGRDLRLSEATVGPLEDGPAKRLGQFVLPGFGPAHLV